MNFATSHPGHAISLGIPVLETERLRLRAPSEADFESDAAFYTSDRAAGVGGKCGRDEVWRHLAALIGHWVFRGYGYWAVEERATGKVDRFVEIAEQRQGEGLAAFLRIFRPARFRRRGTGQLEDRAALNDAASGGVAAKLLA